MSAPRYSPETSAQSMLDLAERINLAYLVTLNANGATEKRLTGDELSYIVAALRIVGSKSQHLDSAQKPSIDPADLWERYLAETETPSPQGAMAFAVEALSNQGASK